MEEKLNGLSDVVEGDLTITEDVAGNKIGLIKDKAGKILETITNKENIEKAVESIRAFGKFALFSIAFGAVVLLTSCQTTMKDVLTTQTQTTDKATTLNIKNDTWRYADAPKEVTTHNVTVDPAGRGFLPSQIDLSKVPEFMSGKRPNDTGSPSPATLRGIRNDEMIDRLKAVSGTTQDLFAHEETKRLNSREVNPHGFTIKQLRGVTLRDARSTPTGKAMWETGEQIAPIHEQQHFMETVDAIRSGQLKNLDPTDDHGNDRDVNRFNVIALVYSNAKPDVTQDELIDHLYKIRDHGAEGVARDDIRRLTGQDLDTIIRSLANSTDLQAALAARLETLLPSESQPLANYYAYLFLKGQIKGINDRVFNAAVLGLPSTASQSEQIDAGLAAEQKFFNTTNAIAELAGNFRISSKNRSASDINETLDDLANELADLLPEKNYGPRALRYEYAKLMIEEYKFIGFSRDIVTIRGYDPKLVLQSAYVYEMVQGGGGSLYVSQGEGEESKNSNTMSDVSQGVKDTSRSDTISVGPVSPITSGRE